MATKQPKAPLVVETLKHDDAKRKNIPTAEYQSVMAKDEQKPVRVEYERRNRDLDPQLVWRGKDEQDWSNLIVQAPPLYIQEKVHPKVLIDDLKRESERRREAKEPTAEQVDLFADFNGLPDTDAKTEFYQHDAHWANRMILGDSLSVMASLAEREGLRGKVQCIYFDPPYGIKFNSNFQWSTTSRDVKDGNADHITREPEQVKAFRDTWRHGIHSYLTYLRDRLTVARDLLTDSGSIFVQIGDENVHRVRALMDEVFGDDNCAALVTIEKTSSQTQDYLSPVTDYVLWYAKNKGGMKFRDAWISKSREQAGFAEYSRVQLPTLERRPMTREEKIDAGAIGDDLRVYRQDNITSQSLGREKGEGAASWFPVAVDGREFRPSITSRWKTNESGMMRLAYAKRLEARGTSLSYVRFINDFPAVAVNNIWGDVKFSSRAEEKTYIVQTSARTVQRCLLMCTDPGDLVLDPTCGSGTTAYVAEQWGRRWITIDTSRVALTLARARIMGARYPYYLLADSRDGQIKEAEVARTVPSSAPTRGNVRQGFVNERVPHITLKSIANNAEINVIWDKYQKMLEPLREQLNIALGQKWQEWEIPRELTDKHLLNPTGKTDRDVRLEKAKELHAEWWTQRISRQREIDASIAAKAEFEYLYDKPYDDKKKVRVAGPFTVESLSPHRVLGVDENDELIDPNNLKTAERDAEYSAERNFVQIILENLKTAGVQQAHKEDKIAFTSLTPWPGELICADARYIEGSGEKRAAVFIGPEFGTVSRPDLVAAAREAGDSGFDVLIACAFNYDAHSSEFDKLGRIPVLKARMNADLHMAEDLKNTGKGNLFVIFGEPDIDILNAEDGQVRVKVNGVDVFHPNTGEVRSDGADGIACWFIDTDYNEESFFVRHAYFLGANDPYKALKTTLKAEINEDAWATLNSDTSRPFDRPKSGRIAVKVINHLGDEVMKVFRVE
ncbi:site-specific DNA-methyltransferase [Ramlibacter sp. WS9]|uniref:site-specific DNA-methyltransferase n=1 Tax=Ramlibacter sp. WS9 TaxID=1882741 RepID=UPI001141E8B2|nr:site-specific DNA-methyltransferase [Ramlibacter sp. WS9]ROZ76153.1 site-specific DNA-methyltransferase [Ramlibacter sp. WS9]